MICLKRFGTQDEALKYYSVSDWKGAPRPIVLLEPSTYNYWEPRWSLAFQC